jgi:Ca2+-binding EF-hand superfamily protein
MMVNILNIFMTTLGPKDVTSTYKTEAKKLIAEADTDGNGSLSKTEIRRLVQLQEPFSLFHAPNIVDTLFLGKDKELVKKFGVVGPSPVELTELGVQDVAKLLATADINRDGKISQYERKNIFSGIREDLNQGKSVKQSYANQWARELKAGVRLPDKKRNEAQDLFRKYNIPKSSYTPTDGKQTKKPGLFARIAGLFNTEKKGTKTDKGTKTKKPGLFATILGLFNR